jgi:hypothetical protein
MIGQGTDGLSRGVWISSLHQAISSRRLLPSLFAPVQYTPLLVSWLVNHHPCLRAETPEWHYIPWDANWSVPDLLDRSTVWCPPPEMASQAISFLLNAYVEAPMTTSSLLLIPRILQRSWGCLSGCITELEVLYPASFPDSLPHAHLLPVCVLHLASHHRVLPTTTRLDSAPLPTDPLHRWHRKQAELLRGLWLVHSMGSILPTSSAASLAPAFPPPATFPPFLLTRASPPTTPIASTLGSPSGLASVTTEGYRYPTLSVSTTSCASAAPSAPTWAESFETGQRTWLF